MKGRSRRNPSDKSDASKAGRGRISLAFRNSLRSLAVEDVPLEAINHIDRTFQYRLGGKLDDLKQSLAQEGQREPVDLLGSPPYRIVDGFRRIGAIQELGWTTVKAFVHSTLSEEEAYALAFTKNVVRKNLTPLDKAYAIHKAKQRGRTTAEIKQRFQLSDRHIRRLEALLSLPPDLHQLVSDHCLSMAHALLLAHLDPADIQAWARRCQEHQWSAEDLRRELRAAGGAGHHPRGRTYIHIEGDRLRLYSCEISRNAPPNHLDQVLESLDRATRFVREARSRSPRRDSTGAPGTRASSPF